MGMLAGMLVGAGAGLAVINLMALIARNRGQPYDLTEFEHDDDVLAAVERWAQQHGYRRVYDVDQTRLYRRGHAFLAAPTFLEVSHTQRLYTFKSYAQINGLILKGDLALSAGSWLARLPRTMARKAQNTLLTALGQPPLD